MSPVATLEFPKDAPKIKRLSLDKKLEWYACRIQTANVTGNIPIELTTDQFQRFWKWRVLVPLKVKRFLYRLKNGQIFKHYPHITEMKKAVKKHSV